MPQSQQTATQKTYGPTIILTGGGSGGHITPLLSLAHALKRKSPRSQVVYVGLKAEKTKGLQERYGIFDKAYFISAGKFRRYHNQGLLRHLIDIKTLLLNSIDLFKLSVGVLQSLRIIRLSHPHVVFSKGGYVAVPVGIAARTIGVPIVTHDSDTVPGLANRIIGRWAVFHATGMPSNYYEGSNAEYVGIPTDERIRPLTATLRADYKQAIGALEDEKVLLVGGAGLGSRDINELVLGAAPKLLAANPKLRLFHISGESHKEGLYKKYQKLLGDEVDRVEVIGFTDQFYRYTGAADLVVSRAGATTLAELALQAKAAILIPAPFLTGGHQLKNASQLAKAGAVEIVNNNASPEHLFAVINNLLSDSVKRRVLGGKLAKFAKPDAAERLADILLAQTK